MPKTKNEKKGILKKLEEKISQSKSVVFAGFDSLGVKENQELREKLGEENNEYLVAKKTLIKLAFEKQGYKDIDMESLSGKVATVFAYDDEISAAKIIDNFRKDKEEKLYFLGGLYEGKMINQQEITALAKLPSREELYAKIVGSINAPVSGLVNVLAANLRNFVYVLKAIEEKKNN
jgi:large subunit ribosomal protein L10